MKKYDSHLNCVVTLTEKLALKQAQKAGREIQAGHYRGPLHGIPWGVKDLFATKDYPTSWGVRAFKDRMIDMDATVIKRLNDAGAVLVAKLSPGELATGDKWYGGQTRNPWNPGSGSGGSSAGPASAVSAGLVGFSIGTETNGSLIGPAMVCGVTGLRPSFGRVSRFGVMNVAWSYDKIGPMCRSVEDCAIVFNEICGPDAMDHSVQDVPFGWEPKLSDITKFRVGYIKDLFDITPPNQQIAQIIRAHKDALDKLSRMGVKIVPVRNIPNTYLKDLIQTSSLGMMAEAAAAHDNLPISDETVLFKHSDWAKRFRRARYIPAVEYIQANRARTLLIQEINKVFEHIDVLLGRITLSGLQSNITGHPELVIPHGLNAGGLPNGVIFTGRLFGESDLLNLVHAYQTATSFHKRHPQFP
ncbi:MAG: amidase [Deltaproteobacteria bacterium]|nr:amidase [Deltaproteobacteria bacterium]